MQGQGDGKGATRRRTGIMVGIGVFLAIALVAVGLFYYQDHQLYSSDKQIRGLIRASARKAGPAPDDIVITGFQYTSSEATISAGGTVVDATDAVDAPARTSIQMCSDLFRHTRIQKITLFWGQRSSPPYIMLTFTRADYKKALIINNIHPSDGSLRYCAAATESNWLDATIEKEVMSAWEDLLNKE